MVSGQMSNAILPHCLINAPQKHRGIDRFCDMTDFSLMERMAAFFESVDQTGQEYDGRRRQFDIGF